MNICHNFLLLIILIQTRNYSIYPYTIILFLSRHIENILPLLWTFSVISSFCSSSMVKGNVCIFQESFNLHSKCLEENGSQLTLSRVLSHLKQETILQSLLIHLQETLSRSWCLCSQHMWPYLHIGRNMKFLVIICV